MDVTCPKVDCTDAIDSVVVLLCNFQDLGVRALDSG